MDKVVSFPKISSLGVKNRETYTRIIIVCEYIKNQFYRFIRYNKDQLFYLVIRLYNIIYLLLSNNILFYKNIINILHLSPTTNMTSCIVFFQ